jgi:transposase
MSNVLSEDKKQQVIALGKLGWSLRRIEEATGVRRETASAYLKTAGVVVCVPGWGRRAPAKPAIQVTPDFCEPFVQKPGAPNDPSPPPASICEQYRELIEQGLARGRNAKAIWQDLVSDHGFSGSYQAVKRFVRKIRGSEREPVGIILTAPGEEAQVDYGSGPMVRHPETGKYRRTRLFVMTLGYSRKSVRLLVWRSSSRVWAELHEKAFRRLGGCARVLVLDNLKEGVLVADIYDPAINPLYRDVLAHYAVTALPCRIQDPDRKGKVESGVGHAKKTPLKGLRFADSP